MEQATCHPNKEVYCKGLCRSCYERQLRNINPQYAENQKLNSRKWNSLNKDKKKEYDKARRKRIPEDKNKKFFKTIKRKFNLLEEEYNKLVTKQDNKCAICGRGPAKNGKKLHLDHCHNTNKVRGLLCAQCNWYLGFIEKDYKILRNILNYLNINLNGSSKKI